MASLDERLIAFLQQTTGARNVVLGQTVQELWGGFGRIQRVLLPDSDLQSVIVKLFDSTAQGQHPRGWNTDVSRERKRASYAIEINWYRDYAALCNEDCRVPLLHGVFSQEAASALVLEDLDSHYPDRRNQLSVEECKLCLSWLAAFHARFLLHDGAGLWQRGCYWHLSTREDELKAMADSPLKQSAHALDETLASAQFKTLVHGDAKVANFCFDTPMTRCAAVDFQYVGRGSGIQDVAYLLGSALSDDACRRHEDALLDHYFDALRTALKKTPHAAVCDELEEEWRELYAIAWADFLRFMLGWMPTHKKVSPYAYELATRALSFISKRR